MIRTAPLNRSVRWFFFFWGAIVLLIAGCATRPATPPTRNWPAPCDTCIAGVSNFSKASPVLWRGEQPTEEGFRNPGFLKNLDIERVRKLMQLAP